MTKRRNLDLDKVMNQAIEIIQADGIKALTLPRLAKELDIRTQSLYNYIANLDELVSLIGARLIREMCQEIKDGIIGLSDNVALIQFASIARRYLLSKGNLALVIYDLHSFPTNSQFSIEAKKLVDLLNQVLASSTLKQEEQFAVSQTLISAVLGFVFIETSNFYDLASEDDVEKSYCQMLKRIITPNQSI